MHIFAQVWCEIDPTLNVRIERASGQPAAEEGDTLLRVSPLGRAAVAAALKLSECTITAFAIGAGHAAALRHALAAGAQRAVTFTGSQGALASVAALADWLGRRADLVIGDRSAGLLAGRLGWAHLAGIDELQMRGVTLHAVRQLGRGDRERVIARLPAAVRLHESATRPPYIARARLTAIAQAPIETVILANDEPLSLALGPLQPARPRTRQSSAAPATGPATSRLQALIKGPGGRSQPAPSRADAPRTPEQLAEEFVRYLKHHALLPAEPDA